MSLAPGSRVGPYEIIGSIGAGGMGEVYRARDPKLGRDVAIKILPDSVARDPDRLARFEREARTLASLNHSNIAQVYGFEAGALVMELLEGETLRERMRDGALPVRKAIEYAVQIARGLAAAHDRGVIHRDLKPENVFVLSDGQIKLLDFGLARTVAPASSGVTETQAAAVGTDPGTVLGTVGYMSPEQVRAGAIDARTDLFSLGAVLYEMLSGERAFRRDTTAETMTAILREEPAELTTTRAEISPAIDRIVRHALEKNPIERFQTARDIAFALDTLSGSTSSIASTPARPKVARERMIWAAVTAMLAAVLAWQVMRSAPSKEPVKGYQLQVPLPAEARSDEFTVPMMRMGLSADGETLAYVGVDPSGARHMWLVSLQNGSARELVAAAGGVGPVFSADGNEIIFGQRVAASILSRKVAIAGGVAESLAPFNGARAWSPSGVVLFSGTYGLRWRDPATSAIKTYDGQPGLALANSFLPDGRHFLLGELNAAYEPVAVHIASLDSPERTKLLDGVAWAAYARGSIAYLRGVTLNVQRFDERTMTMVGTPITLADGVEQTIAGGHAITASPSGTLVFQRPDPPGQSRLQWVDRAGTVLSTIGQPGDYSNAELSPDGKRLLVSLPDKTARTRDIFVVDLARGVQQRLTVDPVDERSAVWSADGSLVYYRSKLADFYSRRSDFTGDPKPLLLDGISKDPYSVSRDGKYLAYRMTGPTRTNDVMLLPLGGGAAVPVSASAFDENGGSFSPDGRSIAYQSDESGQAEIYVASTDGTGGRVQLSSGGGRFPRWLRNGAEIMYISNRMLVSVPVKGSGSTFEAGVATPLFHIDARQNSGVPYDVTADGKRIIIVSSIDGAVRPVLTAIINWPALLARQTAAAQASR